MTPDTDEMTCRELVELVTEYLEDALADAERLRFEAHLTECPYCRAYLEEMRVTVRDLRMLDDDAIEPQVLDGLLEAFRQWKSGH